MHPLCQRFWIKSETVVNEHTCFSGATLIYTNSGSRPIVPNTKFKTQRPSIGIRSCISACLKSHRVPQWGQWSSHKHSCLLSCRANKVPFRFLPYYKSKINVVKVLLRWLRARHCTNWCWLLNLLQKSFPIKIHRFTWKVRCFSDLGEAVRLWPWVFCFFKQICVKNNVEEK